MQEGESVRNGVLPLSLEPGSYQDLVEIGNGGDGTYYLKPQDLEANIVLSLGLSDEWSFELFFLEKGYSVVAVDGSVGTREFIKRFIFALVGFKLKIAYQRAQTLIRYFLLCKFDNFIHLRKFVGLSTKVHFVTLDELIRQYTNENDQIILKCDIEGHEYRILNDIIKYRDRISTFAVEFHDADLHMETIRQFHTDSGYNIAFLQANNAGEIGENGYPTLLEVTFTKQIREAGNISKPSLQFNKCNAKNRPLISINYIE